MKRTIVLLMIVFAFAACENVKVTAVPAAKDREVFTTAISYVYDWKTNDHRIATALKLVIDTMLPGATVKTRETFYFPYETLLLIDSVTAKPVIDSTTGIQKRVFRAFALPKESVLQDFNQDFKLPTDSTAKKP